MPTRSRRVRAAAVERFAAELTAVRDAAGRPSFRVMAGRSRAISHTTLHEASQGHRLPSWETTVEYVKACGGDPSDFRERWENARQRTQRRAPRRPAPTPPGEGATEDGRDEPAAEESHPSPQRILAFGAVGALAATVALVAGVTVTDRLHSPVTPGTRPGEVAGPGAALPPVGVADAPGTTAALTAEDAPCSTAPRASSSATPSPRHSGDVATLVADVTLPDCARVPTGVVRTKTWRLRNTGTVPWTAYSLRRLELPQDGDTCQTIPEVPVPTTLPGESSEVSVEVVMPRRGRACLVHFALTDGAGDLAFPGRRPLHLLVEVG